MSSRVFAFLLEDKPLRPGAPGAPSSEPPLRRSLAEPAAAAAAPWPHALDRASGADAACAEPRAPARARAAVPLRVSDGDTTDDADAAEGSDEILNAYGFANVRARKRAEPGTEPYVAGGPPPSSPRPLTREELERPLPDSDDEDERRFAEAGEYQMLQDDAANERERIGYPALGYRSTPVAPLEELVLLPDDTAPPDAPAQPTHTARSTAGESTRPSAEVSGADPPGRLIGLGERRGGAGDDGARAKVGTVPAHINQYLREYQKEGVRFLWRAYAHGRGAILADEMGLGKTVQTLCFLIALFEKRATADERFAELGTDGGKRARRAGARARGAERDDADEHARAGGAADGSRADGDAAAVDAAAARPLLAAIVCPASVLHQWRRELQTWCHFRVRVAHGQGKVEALEAAKARTCEVLICSYDLLKSDAEPLRAVAPTVVVLDEAHCLKNPKSKAAIGARRLPTPVRIALTGTPMSNEMSELWALLDLVSSGCVGDRRIFTNVYIDAITHGMKLGATDAELARREVARKGLSRLTRIWMLMRRKQVIADQLPRKVDNVVVCPLGAEQAEVYERVLRSADFASLRNAARPCACGSGQPLSECCQLEEPPGPLWRQLHPTGELCSGSRACPFCMSLPATTQLLKLANHLDLVRARRDKPDTYEREAQFARMAWGCEDGGDDGCERGARRAAGDGRSADEVRPWELSERLRDKALLGGCGKLRALLLLLREWREDPEADNRVLLFSYSVRMLDLLALALHTHGYPFLRLDGSTSVNKRAELVDAFNAHGSSKYVFLISTKAGGLGLNLVAANRVVVFDPNWNPAHDLQAQDRAFRIGQRRDVDVYRLLSAGTVEECIYLRQVYKQKIATVALEARNEERVFQAVQHDPHNRGELFGLANLFALQPGKGAPAGGLTAQILARGATKESGLEHVKSIGDVVIARAGDGAASAAPIAPVGGDDVGVALPGAGAASRTAAGDLGEADEHGVGELVLQLEREEEARLIERKRARALFGADASRAAGDGAPPALRGALAGADAGVHLHDHSAVVGASSSAEDRRVAIAVGAVPALHVTSPPRQPLLPARPVEIAKRLLEHARAHSSELRRQAFLSAVASDRELAKAVCIMRPEERDAFAALLNARP